MIARALASVPRAEALAATDLMVLGLWVGSLSLGGTLSRQQVQDVAEGTEMLPPHEFDVLAQVLNEWHVERGGNHPVPYASDLAPA